MRTLLIDNYDSFTWNLVHLFAGVGAEIEVVRNDAASVEALLARAPEAIILSPGPCTPNEAGVCLDLIARAHATTPIFGVCLGLQAIGQSFGGRVVRAPKPMHGKVSLVTPTGRGIMEGIEAPFSAARYHSLVVDEASLPDVLEPHARTADGLLMAASHRRFPVHGVQFHPESVASEQGEAIARNFLALAARWNAGTRAPKAA